jgi:hypothetical protein
LYLGLPAALAFSLVSVAAEMPVWLAVPWNLVVGLVVLICAFPRETRFRQDGSVAVCRRFLALLPISWRTYPRSSLRELRVERYQDNDDMAAVTVWLVLENGGRVPIQSYSAGADNQPPLPALKRDLERITGLRIS